MQTQISLWSDPIERTSVFSQTEITGSGRKFEHTTGWTMFWNWIVQRSIWSEKSDHRCIRAHLSMIINGSSAIGSDQKRIQAHLSLIINCSSPIVSEQKCLGTKLGQIREHFKRFIFFRFSYWEMLVLTRGNTKATFWSEAHLKSNGSDKKEVQLVAKSGTLQGKFRLTGDHDVSYGKLFKLIHWVRNIL